VAVPLTAGSARPARLALRARMAGVVADPTKHRTSNHALAWLNEKNENQINNSRFKFGYFNLYAIKLRSGATTLFDVQ